MPGIDCSSLRCILCPWKIDCPGQVIHVIEQNPYSINVLDLLPVIFKPFCRDGVEVIFNRMMTDMLKFHVGKFGEKAFYMSGVSGLCSLFDACFSSARLKRCQPLSLRRVSASES